MFQALLILKKTNKTNGNLMYNLAGKNLGNRVLNT